MDVDDFEAKSTTFISWLSKNGVVMSPKMAVFDLRSSGRGRGVGEFSFNLFDFWVVPISFRIMFFFKLSVCLSLAFTLPVLYATY